MFYINARGFHWNINGDKFFELCAKFEELYNDLFVKVDGVAERILTLGYTPLPTFSGLSADTGDEGTNALMSDYIREQEKQVWMYSAYLK